MSAICTQIFLECDRAINDGVPIQRESQRDKEFFFQEWFAKRLAALGFNYDPPARNSYPDFRLVRHVEGYELKGLAFPGRVANFDSNSQVPCGEHNGREVFYVFGRYPKDGKKQFPVLDLIICHGDFLDATRDYVHQNKHVKGFGSYGDIMIRDRKMYVVPTPFKLTNGTMRQQTLILPVDAEPGEGVVPVGDLVRVETEQLVAGYHFNLETNVLTPSYVPNPSAGREHHFRAYRNCDAHGPCVSLLVE